MLQYLRLFVKVGRIWDISFPDELNGSQPAKCAVFHEPNFPEVPLSKLSDVLVVSHARF